MSFEFTVLSDERFVEILQAWVDSPWPKPPKTATPYVTSSDGYPRRINRVCLLPIFNLMSFRLALAVDREFYIHLIFSLLILRLRRLGGDSLKDALVIYRHFCEILTSRYGKPKSAQE